MCMSCQPASLLDLAQSLLAAVGQLVQHLQVRVSAVVRLLFTCNVYIKSICLYTVVEAGAFLVRQKARAGGGRKKKHLPLTDHASEAGEGQQPVTGTAPEAEGTQNSPSPEQSAGGVKGGRTGDPFEEAEREQVAHSLSQSVLPKLFVSI